MECKPKFEKVGSPATPKNKGGFKFFGKTPDDQINVVGNDSLMNVTGFVEKKLASPIAPPTSSKGSQPTSSLSNSFNSSRLTSSSLNTSDSSTRLAAKGRCKPKYNNPVPTPLEKFKIPQATKPSDPLRSPKFATYNQQLLHA
eukprot:CAMPEP_0117421338 /NCGR_PEP_ID=MMETSP0758-20121206/2463_1 /TAXON_ID=63605 /ORGANISM="Percolomonas cosmopolitus, Strain AE-1 (ATCC 50343)" /LENGTH=142 /DNA_ID=CAMNT_0005203429 /DNA_START=365 /DNA_END=789 /DNA_ORIENTATION=-